MSADELRRRSFDAWEAMAAGWENALARIEATVTPVRAWLLRELDPRAGETILELAAGPGETGFAAASTVGEKGHLISSDWSPAMVEVGRRRAAEVGANNVEHRVLDAESLDLPDACVDGAVCRFGYMLMVDPGRALRETRRVLRPGGRLVFAVWREAERNPWVAVPGQVFARRGLAPPQEPGAPGMFALASDERIGDLLGGAGFAAWRVEDVAVWFEAESLDRYIADARETGGLFAHIWEEASQDERREMTAELAAAFTPYARGGRLSIPGVAACVRAT